MSTTSEGTDDPPTPGDIDAVAVAESRPDRTVEDVFSDLGDWENARQERDYHEPARHQRARSDPESVSGTS